MFLWIYVRFIGHIYPYNEGVNRKHESEVLKMKTVESIALYFAAMGIMGIAFWGVLMVMDLFIRLMPF